MSATDEARAEAVRRYSSRLIEDFDGDRYDEDEHGYDATARSAFIRGAEWQASRPVDVTDAMVERMARTLFAQTTEARSGWTWPINGDWGRQRDMKDARRVLGRVLAAASIEQTEGE